LAIALAAALVLLGLQSWRLMGEQRAHAETRADHAVLVAASEAAAREAEAAARVEEQRRAQALQEIIDDTESKLARARADAARAADVGQRLRERFSAVASSCGAGAGGSSAASTGPTASATAGVLADVQRRLDEAAGRIAGFADTAHAAGLACERAYGEVMR
jgi:hypothetical protein